MHKKKIILIRHGEAASTWDGDDRDPGLSKKGVDQAKSINDFTKSIFSKGNKPKPKNNNNKPIVPPAGEKVISAKTSDVKFNLAGPGGGRLKLPANN